MDTFFSQLINCFNNIISECSNAYSFMQHSNNKIRKIDGLFEYNLNANIKKTINCTDFIYFNIKKSYKNCSYENINNLMITDKLTNVTTDAYKKQVQRKSYFMTRFLYYSILDLYNKEFTNYNYDADDCLPTAFVDGAHYTFSKNLQKEKIKTNSKGNACNAIVSTILDSENKLPINVMFDKNNNEIQTFLNQLDEIKNKYIFIFDRYYFCRGILEEIVATNNNAVFRLKKSYSFINKFANSSITDTIIYVKNTRKVKKSTIGSIKLRLIKYEINDTIYILGTTLTDKKYTLDFLKELYKDRWQIEEFYKILNSKLSMKKTNAKTLNTIMHDLYSKLLIILISSIIKSASIKYSIVKLKNKETINFTSCMNITIETILKTIFYTQDIDELCRLTQTVRGSTIISEDDRHYSRVAVSTEYKWYHLGYIKKNHNKCIK